MIFATSHVTTWSGQKMSLKAWHPLQSMPTGHVLKEAIRNFDGCAGLLGSSSWVCSPKITHFEAVGHVYAG